MMKTLKTCPANTVKRVMQVSTIKDSVVILVEERRSLTVYCCFHNVKITKRFLFCFLSSNSATGSSGEQFACLPVNWTAKKNFKICRRPVAETLSSKLLQYKRLCSAKQ